MSHRAPAILLLLLSFPLVLLGMTAWNEAREEADVRAWQLQQSASAAQTRDRESFAEYAQSTLERQESAERDRNWLLGSAVMGVGGALLVLVTGRRRPDTSEPAPAEPRDEPRFRPCRACQWQISVEATACPRCGCPHVPEPAAGPQQPAVTGGKGRRAFYITLLALGLGSAAVIYTLLFDDLSETQLVAITPYWIFPSVFGYYGLVAQRMAAKLQTTHLDTVSDQLLNVIKETGFLGQAFAFLIHAPFLLVKSRVPWVTALVGSLIWAIALSLFFNVVFPQL
jgi:hypothetical protein